MSLLKLVVSVIAIVASTKASGFGHFAAVKSFPIVRYAPFYNFPNTVRSIHAVAPAAPVFASAPAPLLPAPLAAPAFPASFLPAPAAPAPILPPPAFTSAIPAPAPAHLFPVPFAAQAFSPALPALAPAVPVLPKLAPTYPIFPRITPIVPTLPAVPFAPIVRPVAPAPVWPAPAPVFAPAPVVAPSPFAVARTLPVPDHVHLYNRLIPGSEGHAPFIKQLAWK